MQLIGNDIFLEYADLTMVGISHSYIENATSKFRQGISKSWANIPDPADARRCLIRLSSIPAATRSKLEAAYKKKQGLPASERINLERMLQDELQTETSQTALQGLQELVKKNTSVDDLNYFVQRGSSTHKAKDQVKACAWLRTLEPINSPSAAKALGLPGITKKADLLNLALEQLKREKLYKLNVGNYQSLQKAITAWRKDGRESLLHKGKGKQNAMKRTPKADQLLLALFVNIEDHGHLLPEQVWMEYMSIAQGGRQLVNQDTGELVHNLLPALSKSTVKAFFNQPSIEAMIARPRFGNKYYKDALRPFVKGEKPRYSLSMTSADGQHIPLVVHGPKDRQVRVVCFLVFDVMSGAIVGWNIDWKETYDSMRLAYANMLELTGGLAPMENQLDNYGRSMKEELQQIFQHVSFCEPYSPQSKYAENFIGQFEKDQLRKVRGWMGSNITSKKTISRQRPLEGQKVHKYTFEEVVKLYTGLIDAWNNTRLKTGKTRMETLWENINPNCQRLEMHTMAQLFGEHRILKITRTFITLTVNGHEYEYETPVSAAFTSSLNNGWYVRVRFLRSQLEQRVWIYNYADANDPEQDEFLAECVRVQKTQRAKAEQGEADGRILGHHLKRQAQFDADHTLDLPRLKVLEAEEITIEEFEPTPEEAEDLLSLGYTDKHRMYDAENVWSQETTRRSRPIDLFEDEEEGGLV